jgi:hypothetical protein
MRLAKLSTEHFSDAKELSAFFADIENREPPGLFRIGQQIAANGLDAGETILFSLLGRVRFVGKSASGRLDNKYGKEEYYPYCFLVDHKSLQAVDVSFDELERRFSDAGVNVSLAGQGWTRLPDNSNTETVVRGLVA